MTWVLSLDLFPSGGQEFCWDKSGKEAKPTMKPQGNKGTPASPFFPMSYLPPLAWSLIVKWVEP